MEMNYPLSYVFGIQLVIGQHRDSMQDGQVEFGIQTISKGNSSAWRTRAVLQRDAFRSLRQCALSRLYSSTTVVLWDCIWGYCIYIFGQRDKRKAGG